MRWNNVTIDPASTDHRARINYIGHLDAVKTELTAAQQLAYWQTLDPPDFRQQPSLSSLLTAAGLTGLDDCPVRALSAGQKRRLSLTRLLMRPAPLWLLDEPATALDSAGQNLLADRIAAHRAAGGAAIIATHQPLGIPEAKRFDLDLLASAHPVNTTTGVWA
jgi:heme exporter protein A